MALKLVAGTSYTPDPAKLAKADLAAARERVLALRLPVADMTVYAALLWMRANMANEAESDRWGDLMVELAGFGIVVLPPHESGVVVGVLELPAALFKRAPELAAYATVLEPGTDLMQRVV